MRGPMCSKLMQPLRNKGRNCCNHVAMHSFHRCCASTFPLCEGKRERAWGAYRSAIGHARQSSRNAVNAGASSSRASRAHARSAPGTKYGGPGRTNVAKCCASPRIAPGAPAQAPHGPAWTCGPTALPAGSRFTSTGHPSRGAGKPAWTSADALRVVGHVLPLSEGLKAWESGQQTAGQLGDGRNRQARGVPSPPEPWKGEGLAGERTGSGTGKVETGRKGPGSTWWASTRPPASARSRPVIRCTPVARETT